MNGIGPESAHALSWLALIWGPSLVILSLGLLRPLKSALIVLQYKHRSEEGRRVN